MGKMVPRLLGVESAVELNELFDDKWIAIWHCFNTTNRIQHDFVFLCKLGLFSSFLRLHWDY